MHPFISVIVPAYNVEKFVVRCLKSLLSQTLRDIEIFVINDGSTDHAPDICARYADTDACIISVPSDQ